jgi:hypothetical protein
MASLIVTRPTEKERSMRDEDELGNPPPQPSMRRAQRERDSDELSEDRSEALLGHDDTDAGGAGAAGIGSGASYASALEGVANIARGMQQLQSILPGSVPPAFQQFVEGLKLAVPQALQDLAIANRGGMTAAQMPGSTAGERVAMMAMAQAVPSQGMGGVLGAQPGMMGGPPQAQAPPTGMQASMAPPSVGPPPGGPPQGGGVGSIPPEALAALLAAAGGGA